MAWLRSPLTALLAVLALLAMDDLTGQAFAHGVAEEERGVFGLLERAPEMFAKEMGR